MTLGVPMIKLANHLFPKQQHPFNMQNDGTKTYAQWQYEMGKHTIAFYLDHYTAQDLFESKTVLDMGCGAAGKSLYYVSLGAKHVVGVDIVDAYRPEAEAFAESLGYSDRFTFVSGDILSLPLPEHHFDTIIMNDFMEHVQNPAGVLIKALTLLSDGGRIYINFPPYYHPFGAHLSDAISIPWVHLFFKEPTLIRAYQDLTAGLPDQKKRLDLRFSKDTSEREYISYINHMTIKKFQKLRLRLDASTDYYAEIPLRPYLSPLAKLPLLKECVVKMVVCVLQK